MNYWLFYIIILLLGCTILLVPLVWSRRTQPSTRLRSLIENMGLSLLVLFCMLMVVELFLKLSFAQSDGFRYTLASQNWYDLYWQENSLGYRDIEWTPELLADRVKIMVVGDSIAAGSGIEDPENRFSNQLGQLLGAKYAVMTVASPGWDTIDEVDAILAHPYRPDILVLSYYINDIEGVAYASGAERPQIRRDPPVWFSPLVQNSHAANFLYWRLIRLGPQEWATIYWEDWLKRISADPEIRWRHRQELLSIIEGAASEQIPLFVIIFPNMAAIKESEIILQPVSDLFREQNVPTVEVSTLLDGLEPTEIVVNAVDSHPSERVHRLVAEHLAPVISQRCQEVSCAIGINAN